MTLSRILPILLMAAACSNVPGNGDSSSSSSGSPGIFLPGWGALFQAACASDQRCASTRGRSYSTLEACLAAFPGDELDVTYNLLFAPASQADLTACAEAIAAADCAETGGGADTPACRRAFRTRTTAVNRRCQNCDVTTQFCGESPSYDGCAASCRPRRALGEPCSGNEECASNRCWNRDGQQDICTDGSELRGRGQTCASSSDCLGSLVCTGAGAPTCQERVGLGATCGGGSAECYADLVCANARCVAKPSEGAACNDRFECASGVCNTATQACVSASVCE
jgi:hypothetical protein